MLRVVESIPVPVIAALNGDGIETLRTKLAAMMKPGPWLYPEDQISDAPLRMLAMT